MNILVLLLILALLFGGGGVYMGGWSESYGRGGISLGFILLVILIVMLARGRL